MVFEHGSEYARQELYQWVISPALMNFLNIVFLKMTQSVCSLIYLLNRAIFPPQNFYKSANAF